MTGKFNADTTLFTSDTHFFHEAMIGRTALRNFNSVQAMNDHIVLTWNQLIRPTDTVFHLGDISFGRPHETLGILGQLNGNIILVRGNHDKKLKSAIASRFSSIHDYFEADLIEGGGTKQRICMMHFALRTWNRHHYGSWHLHGHSHGSLAPLGRSMDVGLDTNFLEPYTYQEIKNLLTQQKVHTNDHHWSHVNDKESAPETADENRPETPQQGT